MLQSEIKLIECLACRVDESLDALIGRLSDSSFSLEDRVHMATAYMASARAKLAKLTNLHLELLG